MLAAPSVTGILPERLFPQCRMEKRTIFCCDSYTLSLAAGDSVSPSSTTRSLIRFTLPKTASIGRLPHYNQLHRIIGGSRKILLRFCGQDSSSDRSKRAHAIVLLPKSYVLCVARQRAIVLLAKELLCCSPKRRVIVLLAKELK